MTQVESRTEKKHRNENIRDRSQPLKNPKEFEPLSNQKEFTAESVPTKKSGPSRNRNINKNTKNDNADISETNTNQEYKNTNDFKELKFDEEKPNENYETDSKPRRTYTRRVEQSKSGPSQNRNFNRNTPNNNAEKFETKTNQEYENIKDFKEQKFDEEKPNDADETDSKARRTFTRKDEQNIAVKEFKIKPTVEVETERPRFVPSAKRTSANSREDSTEVDSENDEVRVPGKLKYHLYEPSTRKKLATQPVSRQEIATVSNKGNY